MKQIHVSLASDTDSPFSVFSSSFSSSSSSSSSDLSRTGAVFH